MEDDIGAVAFQSSDDRDAMIPVPDDVAAAARGGGASIAERRAAKFGFNAVKINTARFRTASPTTSPAARSPCLTIPPGISPTALLDSPIMLHNSMAMPSPTTGSFPLPYYGYDNSVPILTVAEDVGSESFKFKPYPDHKSLGGSTFGNQEIESANQALVLEQPCAGFEFPTDFPGESATNFCGDHPETNGAKVSGNIITEAKPISMKLSQDVVVDDEQSRSREPVHGENGTHEMSEANQGAYNSYGSVARTSEDGYNWRKYGQKQVKGSEYPRSYYKCTHPNCQVKKKVERSLDGQITEIIYKGAHNHAKPQPNRRGAFGSALSFDEMSEVSEGGSAWTNNIQSGSDVKIGSDGRSDGMEITSSASILTELSDPFSTTHGKSICTMESTETPELSSTIASHDDDEDGATQGSMSLIGGGDADDEESESKRRKKENCFVETTLTSRAVREPRVVVQIESEVDILDDGYRWRKYGQKVVKGNPNPRSYYKCTSAGCSVRKHVERASHNLKCVITTYEGKHNHEVPAARNGNHSNPGGANSAQPAVATNPQPPLALQRNSTIPKPETQIQDFPPQFDRKPEFGTDYLRPPNGFPGNFGNDVRFGPASIYQMKYPPLQTNLPYAPFGLNPNRFAPQQQQPVPIASVLPDFPMSMPPSLVPHGNLPPMVGFDYNGPKQASPVPPPMQNDAMLLRPKQEQRDDAVYNPAAANAPALSSFSSSSPAYNRVMGRF